MESLLNKHVILTSLFSGEKVSGIVTQECIILPDYHEVLLNGNSWLIIRSGAIVRTVETI